MAGEKKLPRVPFAFTPCSENRSPLLFGKRNPVPADGRWVAAEKDSGRFPSDSMFPVHHTHGKRGKNP